MPDPYHLVVIGGGAAGQKAAMKAALFGRRVALIDRPSKSAPSAQKLKQIVLKLQNLPIPGLFGTSVSPSRQLAIPDSIKQQVREIFFEASNAAPQQVKALTMRNVDLYPGSASFLNLDEIKVDMEGKTQVLEGRRVLIATGSSPMHPDEIPFSNSRVFDSNSIFEIAEVPSSIFIYGGHEIPCVLGTIFALMGSKVTLAYSAESPLPMLDADVSELYLRLLRQFGIDLIPNAKLKHVDVDNLVRITLTNGKSASSEAFLYADIFTANVAPLMCSSAGIIRDEQGNIKVDGDFRTSTDHIFAVGETVRSPIFETVRADQGRIAVAKMFGLQDAEQISEECPVGLSTLPEIAWHGLTEQQIRKTQVKYVTGKAFYRDTFYGSAVGIQEGFLKLIINKDQETVEGVHIVGPQAQNLVQMGMSIIAGKTTLSRIIGSVFTATSLDELYIQAALDGLFKLRGKS